jgi:putative SOS response-associated peptidase YedK
MCGRYSNAASFSEIQLAFRTTFGALDFAPRLNIAPTFQRGWEVPIVIAGPSEGRELRLARFWFIPEYWKKPLSGLASTFNARSETLFQKPYFKDAARHHRCLVPATGWREFVEGQPYHFVPTTPQHLVGQPLFAFAGIHSRWTGPDGEETDSFAIVTCEPTPIANEIHDRMPLVLPTALYQDWLSGDNGEALLESALSEAEKLTLRIYASDRAANDSRYEGPLATREVRAPAVQLDLFQAKRPLGS